MASVDLSTWDIGTVLPLRTGSIPVILKVQQRLNDLVIELAAVEDGQDVLDVGCGFGGTLAELNTRLRDVTLVGVNIDSRQLDICRELKAQNQNSFQWLASDACQLPLPSASFDRILCIEAMFHFTSRRNFIQEAARILRPGGVFVFSDILLSKPLPDQDCPAFLSGSALQDGYGPWPDLWGSDSNHKELGKVSGLHCVCEIDGTENTLPSHQFTVPSGLDLQRDPIDSSLRASMTLRWLHHHGNLKYVFFRFDKPMA